MTQTNFALKRNQQAGQSQRSIDVLKTCMNVLERTACLIQYVVVAFHTNTKTTYINKESEQTRNQQQITHRKQEQNGDRDGARALKQHRNDKAHTNIDLKQHTQTNFAQKHNQQVGKCQSPIDISQFVNVL